MSQPLEQCDVVMVNKLATIKKVKRMQVNVLGVAHIKQTNIWSIYVVHLLLPIFGLSTNYEFIIIRKSVLNFIFVHELIILYVCIPESFNTNKTSFRL